MIIYLDSSFITNCAEEKSSLIEYIRTKSDIFIASSVCHIVEALPKTESAINKSLARLKIINDKNIAKPVLPFTEILEKESYANSLDAPVNILCQWHEIFMMQEGGYELANVKKDAKANILKHVNDIIDPNTRRQTRARFILRGKLRLDRLEEALAPIKAKMLEEAKSKFPEIAPIFESGGLYDAILDKVSSKDFSIRIRETLIHPAVLAKLSFHPEFDVAPISNFFWDQSEKLASIIGQQVHTAAEVQLRSGVNFNYFISEMEKYFLSDLFYNDTISKIGNHHITDVKMMPGTKNLVGMLAQLSLKKLRAHANPSQKTDFLKPLTLKKGDFGDAMHTIYQPYVDIFCCDRKTKILLEKLLKNRSNICCTEEELLHRISAR